MESAIVADLTADGEVVEGSERTIAVDVVCTSGGLAPLLELLAQAGCPQVFVPQLGGYAPLHGPDMQTSLAGIWVAGCASGVEGAKVAMGQGRLAGTATARACGRFESPLAEEKL